MKKWQITSCSIAGALVLGTGLFLGGNAVTGNLSKALHLSSQHASPIASTNTDQQLAKENDKTKKNTIQLHFKWKDSQPHVAYTVASTDTKTSFPGVPMKDEGNGWYSCTIEDAKNAELTISVPELDYQTSSFTKSAGEYWYSEEQGWSEEAPANYTITETSDNQQVVKTSNLTEIDVPETNLATEQQIIVHYPVSAMENASIYYWNLLPTDQSVNWPGTQLSSADGYYTYTFNNCSKVNFLFTNGNSQSEDYTLKKAGEYWLVDNNWTTQAPSGSSGGTQTSQPSESTQPVVTKKPSQPVIELKKSDFRDETIYFVMTSRFYDGDSSNNCVSWRDTGTDDNHNNPHNANPVWRGDFKGLVEKLDYIKELGFTAIWITPVVKNASDYDYHGYHAINHAEVDCRFESSDCDYQDLINAAHQKGIKIIQDIVLNHCSDYGEENLFPAYTRTNDISKLDKSTTALTVTDLGNKLGLTVSSGEGARCAALKSDTNDPNFIFHHEKNCQWEGYTVQTGQMGAHCVDLNTENPIVCNYLKECYNNYIKQGVDAFRIDTVKHVSRLAFNKEFLKSFKATGGSNFFMFGEACVLRNEVFNAGIPAISVCFYSWDENKTYTWQNSGATIGSGYDPSVVNATNLAETQNNMNLVAQNYEDNSETNNQRTSDNAFLNGNSYHTPDYSQASGMGMIDFYMHHKFGSAGSAFNTGLEEDKYFNDSTWNVMYVDSHDYGPNEGGSLYTRYNGGTAAWAENLDLIFTFRGIPCIYYGTEVEFMAGVKTDDWYNDLDKTGRAYFGDYLEAGKIDETLNSPLSLHLKRLNAIRKAVPALRKGQYSIEGINGSGCAAYKRRYTANGEDSFVLVTISGNATFSGIPGGTYVDLVSGNSQTISEGGSLTASVSEQGNMAVYVLQNDTATAYGATGKIGASGTFLK